MFVVIIGGYSGQATYPAQYPNPSYPMQTGYVDAQTAFKPQAPYPTATAYPPVGSAYVPPPQQASYQGSPYQPTSSPSVHQPYEQHEYHDDEAGIVGTAPDWAGSSFSDKKIRHIFIRKVCFSP